MEESLDIEWAHAMAPMANIILFEASDTSNGLYTAVQTAANTSGVVAISMSWSGSEFSGETADDSTYFATPSGHVGGAASLGGAGLVGGITFLAATGDNGAYAQDTSTITPQYPACSPNVIAVGGTSLTVGADDSYGSETSWGNGTHSGTKGGGGGGISVYESQPSYQSGVVNAYSTTARTYPDVSADANPSTGVPIYDSWDFGTSTPWVPGTIGGTSLACPLWAGVITVADQGRAIAGLGSLNGAEQTLPELYQTYQVTPTDFHDITSGNSIGSSTYTPGTGYDLATGLGSPVCAQLIPQLVGLPAPTVTNVLVSSTAWTTTYLSNLASQNSMNVGGYSIPVGSGAQLLPLPGGNINQIEVVFSENVVVNQADLLLTGVNVPSYNVSGGTFSYDPGTFTATWTLPQPIEADKLMLALNADGSNPIEDAAGDPLDGEWTNPTSTTAVGTSTYPSGNGVAGGDFDFRFNVLPGDATQDGVVGPADLSRLLTNYGKTDVTWSHGDFTGDGIVGPADLSQLLTNYGQSLPSSDPVAGTFPADVLLTAAIVPTAVSSGATVPSQANAIPDVAMAKASEVFQVSASVTTPIANGHQPTVARFSRVLTAGVGDWSSPPVVAATEHGLSFVVRPIVSAVQNSWADTFNTPAGRPTKPLEVAIDNTSPWDEAVSAARGLSSSVPGGNSTSLKQTQDLVTTVCANHVRAHDAVLAGELVAPLPSEMSRLSDVAAPHSSQHPIGDLESLTDAVDDALTTYDHEPYEA